MGEKVKAFWEKHGDGIKAGVFYAGVLTGSILLTKWIYQPKINVYYCNK